MFTAWQDKQIVIVGLGLTGLSCACFLAARGCAFSVVDSRQQPPGLEQYRAEFAAYPLQLGGIDDAALAGAELLVVSPGVSLAQPAIARAIAAGVAVCGDIDLFRAVVSAPLALITGSNGKSTVTTLLGDMARSAGLRVAVGGNLGVPALDLLDQGEVDLYVLELSSFQLERCQPLSAEVAVVLNISADHMDRYASLQDYHRAKHRIFEGCRQAVINRADPLTHPLLPQQVKQFSFGLDQPDFAGFGLRERDGQTWLAYQFDTLMAASELLIAGRHNIENALAALALGHALGLPFAPMLAALRSFRGLAHRCQFVAQSKAGLRFYNDSKGTNPGATIAAIGGLASAQSKVVLIAGGEGKGADFSVLRDSVREHCRALILIGEAAGEIGSLNQDILPCIYCESLEEAVAQAQQQAQPQDVVLLSPACASFDMFANYQQRGERFCTAVQALVDAEGRQ